MQLCTVQPGAVIRVQVNTHRHRHTRHFSEIFEVITIMATIYILPPTAQDGSTTEAGKLLSLTWDKNTK